MADPRRSAAYQRLAAEFLDRSAMVCHWCGCATYRTVRPGHPLKATVDHLVEVRLAPELALDVSLWVVACSDCNSSRGARFGARLRAGRAGPAPSRDW